MFRKPAKRKEQAVRQRVETAPEDEEEKTEIVKDAIKRRRRDNPMLQSTKKREEKDNNDSSSSSDDEVVNEHAFPSSGIETSLGPSDRGATFVSEHDTAADADAHSQFERVQQILKEGGVEKDGKVLYKGMAMYGAKIAPDTAKGNAANGLNRIGPMRAPQFLRQTVRWDYAPDICKDYKETGFCTFGDSCKFMHDRGDYKHGWEIERDYLAGTLNQDDDTNYEIPLEEDELPEDCFICGNPFDNPIVTNCKHYFCESCAIQAFKKSKKCRICNENTGGIFNVAKDLIQKMKQREAAKEEEKEESGDEEEEEKPEIKQEMEEEDHHHHHEGCSHSHEVKEEAPGEEDEAGEDEEEEEVVEEEPQEEMDIKMEEIEDDDGNVSNSSDIEDEEKEE